MKTAEEFNNEVKAIPNKELCEIAIGIVNKLCATGGKSYTMTVPPRIDDSDIVLSEVIKRLYALTSHPTTLPSDEDGLKAIRTGIISKHLQRIDKDNGVDTFFAYHEAMEEYASARISEMEREIKRLQFMIENGLGAKDIKNDI